VLRVVARRPTAAAPPHRSSAYQVHGAPAAGTGRRRARCGPGRRPPAAARPWCCGWAAAAERITVTPIVSTARQSGRTSIRVISPSATLMSSWWACSPSRRLSERRPSRRPRSGRGAAGRRRGRPDQARSRGSPVPTPMSRARATELSRPAPTPRTWRGRSAFSSTVRTAARATGHRPHRSASAPRGGDVVRRGPARVQTAEVQLDGGMPIPCHLARREPPGPTHRTRRTRTRCRLSC
jgi:hypothetical protein